MPTRTRHSRRSRPGIPAPRRIVAAYLRLTVDREGDKIGYDVQRKEITRWAKANGYDVVWFQDKDLTAADLKVVRPQYEAMLKRVGAGEFAGIVMWRLDRLVRLVRELERCFGITEDAGAFILSVDGGFNTQTEIGKMFMRLIVMMAEMEISAMRIRSRAHHNLMAQSGKLSTGGCRPFGFIGVERDENGAISNKADAGIRHHPVEAPLIRAAAERVALHGATYTDIAREWSELAPPIVGTRGGALPNGRVREILASPRMAAYREYDLFDDEGGFAGVALAELRKVDPIIPRDIWEILNSQAMMKSTGPRTTANEYLFTGGLAKCGECGFAMIGATIPDPKTGGRAPIYRCNASVPARKSGSCGKPLVRASYLEDVVLERLVERLEATPELHGLMNTETDSDVAAAREGAVREIKFCNEKLSDLGNRTSLREDNPQYLTEPEAAGRAKGFRQRLQEAQKALQEVTVASTHRTPNETERKDIRGWLESLSLGERRSWLALHVAEVLVDCVERRSPTFDPNRVRTLFTDAEHRR